VYSFEIGYVNMLPENLKVALKNGALEMIDVDIQESSQEKPSGFTEDELLEMEQ
jgi:hypothetical protein